jgi:hypothetical protein
MPLAQLSINVGERDEHRAGDSEVPSPQRGEG